MQASTGAAGGDRAAGALAGRNVHREGRLPEDSFGSSESIQGTECDEVLIARESNAGGGSGSSQEISFDQGERIRVTWKHPSGWWYGSREGAGTGPEGAGEPVGWFPGYKLAP